MKQLNQYIKEKLIINKDYRDAKTVSPKSFDELRKIIEDRYKKLGPGAEQKPIDFNDIDVSNLYFFCNDKSEGIFEYTKFKYIDISSWDVSNAKSMRSMFYGCDELKSVGDISKWDVSNVTDMRYMFFTCEKLGPGTEQNPIDFNDIDVSNIDSFCNDKGIGLFSRTKFKYIDISSWDVSNIKSMRSMFYWCKELKSVGDISEWDVSNVTDMQYMFCNVVNFNQDISSWDVSNVRYRMGMFDGCRQIKKEYRPKFKY